MHKIKNSPCTLLDTTIREGSYVINFQFTQKEVYTIAKGLDQSGIQYIEMGHGLGLGAGNQPSLRAAASDDAYFEAVSAAVQIHKWGCFFIPGIGKMSDITKAARYGADFIRIGTNVTEVENGFAYIQKAKSLGLEVHVNFMKTYAIPIKQIGLLAKKVQKYGADIVTIVDSAGGMLPEDVADYFTAIQNHANLPIGFHGHNNLGLAVANSLKAVSLGAVLIDTSLRGLGRSAGNVSTEQFLFVLKRYDINLPINANELFKTAEKHIDRYLNDMQYISNFGIMLGFTQMHSSCLDHINYFAKKYRISPFTIIIAVSAREKVHITKQVIKKTVEDLLANKITRLKE